MSPCPAAGSSSIPGGGPTDDKPAVTLETPPDPGRVSSFLNIRVKDIDAVYAQWSARGARFLTPPRQHQYEKRCYIRDPDGHLIEVGQTTDSQGDWSPAHWPPAAPAQGSAGRSEGELDLGVLSDFVHGWWISACDSAHDPDGRRRMHARAAQILAGEPAPSGRPWREILAERDSAR